MDFPGLRNRHHRLSAGGEHLAAGPAGKAADHNVNLVLESDLLEARQVRDLTEAHIGPGELLHSRLHVSLALHPTLLAGKGHDVVSTGHKLPDLAPGKGIDMSLDAERPHCAAEQLPPPFELLFNWEFNAVGMLTTNLPMYPVAPTTRTRTSLGSRVFHSVLGAAAALADTERAEPVVARTAWTEGCCCIFWPVAKLMRSCERKPKSDSQRSRSNSSPSLDGHANDDGRRRSMQWGEEYLLRPEETTGMGATLMLEPLGVRLPRVVIKDARDGAAQVIFIA